MSELIVHSSAPVVLVGGADLGPDDLNIFRTRSANFVGVDGGADHLLRAGIEPVAVIGDLDSLSPKTRIATAKRLHPILEQDTVDFEKALTRVDAPIIYAVGFWGGRVDHSLAVLNVLGRHSGRRVILVGPQDVSLVLPQGGFSIDLAATTRVSLMPLGPSLVKSSGLRWEVTGLQMDPLGQASPSNEAIGGEVRLDATGVVLLSVPLAQLPQVEAALTV